MRTYRTATIIPDCLEKVIFTNTARLELRFRLRAIKNNKTKKDKFFNV